VRGSAVRAPSLPCILSNSHHAGEMITFVMEITAVITASATGGAPNDARVLECLFFPPVRRNAARPTTTAARAMLGANIPAEGRPVV
jgi:hypothetical protein